MKIFCWVRRVKTNMFKRKPGDSDHLYYNVL